MASGAEDYYLTGPEAAGRWTGSGSPALRLEQSASVLFGIGGPALQRAVLDAQAVAVESALEYLEEHACRTRRGAGGYEIVPGGGFVGAAFRHRTSRAGDPQVHTHLAAEINNVADAAPFAPNGD